MEHHLRRGIWMNQATEDGRFPYRKQPIHYFMRNNFLDAAAFRSQCHDNWQATGSPLTRWLKKKNSMISCRVCCSCCVLLLRAKACCWGFSFRPSAHCGDVWSDPACGPPDENTCVNHKSGITSLSNKTGNFPSYSSEKRASCMSSPFQARQLTCPRFK
jgi:hypothetical protein